MTTTYTDRSAELPPQPCPSHQVACVIVVSARVAEDITAEQLRQFCHSVLSGSASRLSGELFGELADHPKRVVSISGPRSKLLQLAARSVQQHAADEAAEV